jgi:UTP--glucose-1-phosphate uridylyltransferase
VGDEPFLLMLGDHIYASDNETSCARQLLDVYDRSGHSVVGLKVTQVDELHKFGCASGVWEEADSILAITEFYEKPEAEYAREHLHVEGMADDLFLTMFGQYVLSPRIFAYLEENITHNVREKGEFQLTSCLDKLRREDGFTGVVINGRRFDIGMPEAYRQTVIDYRNV